MPSPSATPSDMNALLLPEPVQGNSVRQKQGCCSSQAFCTFFLTGWSCILCILVFLMIVVYMLTTTVFNHMVEEIVEEAQNKTIAEGLKEGKDEIEDIDNEFFYIFVGAFSLCFLCLFMACRVNHISRASIQETVSRISTAPIEDVEHQQELATKDREHQAKIAAMLPEHNTIVANYNEINAKLNELTQRHLTLTEKVIQIQESVSNGTEQETDSSDSSDYSSSDEEEDTKPNPEPEPEPELEPNPEPQSNVKFVM